MAGDYAGVWPVELEIRQVGGNRTLSGVFNYGSLATIRDRGTVRKERFSGDAFGWQLREFARLQQELADLIGSAVETVVADARADAAALELRQESPIIMAKRAELAARNMDLLYGHDFNRPLASMLAGTLAVTSDAQALRFDATLPPDDLQPSWMRDAVMAVNAKLVRGLSPGFRVPPRSAVPNGEELVPEPGNESVMIRQINQALAGEWSLVTRPAYTDSEIREAGGAHGPQAATLWL